MDVEGLRSAIDASARIVSSLGGQVDAIAGIAGLIVTALKDGHKVLTAGNGGSAAESLHMAEELTGRYRTDRIALPGISLVADSTALTCIGNDYGFDRIFSRQVEGLGKAGDVLVLFSTSGNAANLKLAAEMAAKKGLKTVCLLGRDGGSMAGVGDAEIIIEGDATERIQEAHQVIVHLVLDVVETEFS